MIITSAQIRSVTGLTHDPLLLKPFTKLYPFLTGQENRMFVRYLIEYLFRCLDNEVRFRPILDARVTNEHYSFEFN